MVSGLIGVVDMTRTIAPNVTSETARSCYFWGGLSGPGDAHKSGAHVMGAAGWGRHG